jgi:hypothetical protein
VLAAARPILAAIGDRDAIARELVRDQLLARLRGGQREGERVDFGKFLRDPRPPVQQPAPLVPLPPGPSRPPLRELELLEIVLWYPVFLAELQRCGALDALQDEGIGAVLRALCVTAGQSGLDLEAVARWVREQPDGAGIAWARSCLMDDKARVPAAQAASAFRERASRVVLDGMRRNIELIATELRATPPGHPRYSSLAEELQAAQTGRRHYEQALRQMATAGAHG